MTVSVLTGRDVASARALLGLTSVIYHGNHGIESWERGVSSVLPEAQASKRQLQRLFKSARSKLGPKVGVMLEDKTVALAFHYRQATNPDGAREAIMDFLARSPDTRELVVYEGKMVVEVHVPVTTNKGTSLRSVVEAKGLHSALVLGDDHTDVDSFKMLGQLRQEGVLQGIGVAVLGSNTPDDLLGVADYTLADTESVEVFLMWLARELNRH
jgi:trehalose 6-phosphate phosphatase